jgi:four helix bundle protein
MRRARAAIVQRGAAFRHPAREFGVGDLPADPQGWGMHKYRSLVVWRRAHELLLVTLRATDAAYHPRSRSLFDQIRRAVISVEANVVEGYALGTRPQFRRHLRIARGSAAEAECLVRAAGELGYLSADAATAMERLLDEVLALLFGLLRAPDRSAS